MRLITNGLIIREKHIGEYDRLITVLTQDRGMVRAFATGALRLKSRIAAATQLLCYSSLTLYQAKDTYRVNEAQAIEVFFALRSDMEKLSAAQYFCELAGALAPEEDDASAYLRLMLNALQFLAQDRLPLVQIKAIVELRMLSLAGYMPDLTACTACGQYEGEEMFLDCLGGHLLCAQHRTPGSIALPRGVLAAMRHIVYSDFEKLFFFTLPAPGLRMLAQVCEKYLLCQLDRTFSTLDFYHTLFPDAT